MSNQAYFPNSDADRVTWLVNFKTKLTHHMPMQGVGSDDVVDIIADIDFYVWLFGTCGPTIQKAALEMTAYKAMIAYGDNPLLVSVPFHAALSAQPPVRLSGILKRVFNIVQRIKISHSYNESIGKDLAIIGVPRNSQHLTPPFSLDTERGAYFERVKLNFLKYQHDGVYIECRRNSGVWVFLAIAMLKPYYDEQVLLDSNLSEIREYRLRWWDKGNANGEYSPVQKVTVGS